MDVEIPVEIPDVWAGPKTYAEDYYSRGDVRPDPGVEISAHHLGIGDQKVNISTSGLTATIGEAEPNDVIVMALPKESPGARLDQLLESSEQIAQSREVAQIIEDVDKIMSSPLHPPIQEIFESQDSQLPQELSFDDIYDIDMASFDASTFSVDQTGMRKLVVLVNTWAYLHFFTRCFLGLLWCSRRRDNFGSRWLAAFSGKRSTYAHGD